ncbi:hypothetical protein D3C71_234300 [compost metagenome]
MPKVYVVNNRHHDFSSAEKYGQLVYLTEGIIPVFKTATLMDELKEKLVDFDHKNDVLLISGPSIANMLAAIILSRKSTHKITVLIYDAKEQKYVARTLEHC